MLGVNVILYNCKIIQHVPKKLRIFGWIGRYFLKLTLNSKISCISTSFEKEIRVLSHIAKKLQDRQYLQNCL